MIRSQKTVLCSLNHLKGFKWHQGDMGRVNAFEKSICK